MFVFVMNERVVKWIAKIANCDCEKTTISQITQFSFLSVGRNRNTTQFDFLEGPKLRLAIAKVAKIIILENFFPKNWSIETGF